MSLAASYTITNPYHYTCDLSVSFLLQSPLVRASENGHTEIVNMLLKTEGIDADDEDVSAYPCHALTCVFDLPLWRVMVMFLANLFPLFPHLSLTSSWISHFFQNDGMSAIWAAMEHNHPEVVVALAEAGADVDQISNHPEYEIEGNTLLHIASQRGNAEVVSALMACNAFLKEENVFGQLPIDVAANDEIRQLINDEMTARFDHGFKRAVITAPPPAVGSEAEAAAVDDPDSSIQSVGDAGTVSSSHATAAAASVASEDEDSEESSDEKWQWLWGISWEFPYLVI